MKAMNATLRKIASLYVFILTASTLWSQVATGNYTYGTFDSKGLDTINVGNLNVHLAIPVLSKAGRGIPFSYNLGYHSSVWMPTGVSGSQIWQPVANWGWAGITEVATGYISYNTSSSVCYYRLDDEGPERKGTYTEQYNYAYHDMWGITHPFAGYTWQYTPSLCGASGSSLVPLATDGSGYSYTSKGITARNGTLLVPPSNSTSGAATATDRNGNEISVSASGQFTDTTGKVALTVAGSGTASSPMTFAYTDTNGNPQTVTMNYTTYTVETAFGCSGIAEFGPTAEPLVSSITFPDGSSYNFSYEATPGHSGDVTGRLAGVTLRQGDTIQYVYTGGSNGIECADGSTAGLTRTLNGDSGSAASSLSYARTITGSGTSSTAVVDGMGNAKNYTFVEANNQPSGTTAVYYETSRSIYQGAVGGTPVIARNTCYNGAASPCTTASFALPVTQIDTYKTLNGMETDGRTAKYNAYGMQTEADVYDFGASSRSSLLRQEIWTYGYSIPSLVTVDEVFDVGVTLAGETIYTYDGTAPTASSGVPQHVAVTGARGNLTSMTQDAGLGISYLSTFTYEDTGSLLSSTTHGATTTYTYDPAFVYNTGATLPTPSSGVALSTSALFDTTNTGLPLSSTDANGQITKIPTYDAMLRPTEVEYPDGGETTFSYSPTVTAASVPAIGGTAETQYDGYGRQSRTETANGSGYYQQDVCYDGNGNAAFKSYRYAGSGFGASKVCSGAGDSYTYDVLGRMTSVTRANGETRSITYLGRAKKYVDENGVTRISQVDGLGRTSIVCEISSNTLQGASPTTCGTDIAGTGFVTSYRHILASHTTTITQGAQTRTFVSDWLGRPTSIVEPEGGTTTYSYAYTSTGLQVTRQRPKANQTSASVTTTTTTQYDSVGRVVSISYTDGTPTKTFAYDASAGTSFSDLTQANLKGQLSLASIAGTAGTAYSYDPMGRTSALDECLLSGCGTVAYNKQLQYTYDLAGDMTSSTDGAGVVSTYTFSPASEILSLTSSINNATDPADLVSSVQNGPFGPVSYSLGNGLTGTYSYDALGRLSGGSVSSGGTQVYGFADGWKGQQLTGSSDSVLDQASTYGYDEFNRLTSRTVNAGTVQNYTWAYDRYGNRVQQNMTGGTGSGSTFSASVNAANNQLAGYTYDAAGNMTNDGFHSYTYDAEGHITAVDGGQTASYVYNALNQRVQVTAGGTITNYVFNAAGQRVSEWNGATNAQIEGKYYWGAKPVAYYAGGTTHFEHQDWLGTERMRTAYNGAVEGWYTSLPFGDGQTVSGLDTDANHYAMLDHDRETDTDYAQYRQYANMQGRWLSPDPYSGSYKRRNPQSFNRYVYAGNNPLAATDTNGLCYEANAYDGFACPLNDQGGDPNLGMGSADDGGDEGLDVTLIDPGTIPEVPYDYSDSSTVTVTAQDDSDSSQQTFVPISDLGSAPNNGECDNACQLAHALGKTGVYQLTTPTFYGCSGAIAVGTAATIAAPYGVGLVAGISVAAQKAVDTTNKWIGAKPGDMFYQYGPRDFAQAFGHTCLGTTGTTP
jgi:RHS repeat-associated protein